MSVASVASVAQKKPFILSLEQDKFLTYVRTKQVFSLRYRGKNDEMQSVHISSIEIEDRFFPYPKFKRKNEVQALIDNGHLSISVEDKRFLYEVLHSGAIDLSLLITKPLPPETFYNVMVNYLKYVSLPRGTGSTDYFNLFLRYKDTRPELFFKVDAFAGRVHTPISNFHRHLRPFILIDGEKTDSLDVATMQPLILGKILTSKIGKNEFSDLINEGKDIYLIIQDNAGLHNRDEAKNKYYKIAYGWPSKALSNLFGASDWINWINDYKATNEPLNPHGIETPHTNLAWLLQTTEVKIMSAIWKRLISESIKFLSVHDEIITKATDIERTYQIMSEVLASEFEYFRLSGKNKSLFSSTLATLKQKETAQKQFRSTLPPQLVEIQKEYCEMEQAGHIAPEHHQRVSHLWGNAKDCLKNNGVGIAAAIQELREFKNLIRP